MDKTAKYLTYIREKRTVCLPAPQPSRHFVSRVCEIEARARVAGKEEDADRKIVWETLSLSLSLSRSFSSRQFSESADVSHRRALPKSSRSLLAESVISFFENSSKKITPRATFAKWHFSFVIDRALILARYRHQIQIAHFHRNYVHWQTYIDCTLAYTCEKFIFKDSVRPKSCFESIYCTYDIHIEIIIKPLPFCRLFLKYVKWLIYMF